MNTDNMKKLFDRVDKMQTRINEQDKSLEEQFEMAERTSKNLQWAVYIGGAALACVGIYAMVTRGKLSKVTKKVVEQDATISKFKASTGATVGKMNDLLLDEARRGKHNPAKAIKLFDTLVEEIAQDAAYESAKEVAERFLEEGIYDKAADAASMVAGSIAQEVGARAGRGAALEYSLGLH